METKKEKELGGEQCMTNAKVEPKILYDKSKLN